MKIICNDKEFYLEKGAVLQEALKSEKPDNAIAARYNNEVASLNHPMEQDGKVVFKVLIIFLYTFSSNNGTHKINVGLNSCIFFVIYFNQSIYAIFPPPYKTSKNPKVHS